jgi:hypothetical protein
VLPISSFEAHSLTESERYMVPEYSKRIMIFYMPSQSFQ